MRLTTGSMLTLADDLRADDSRDADTRRWISQPTATLAADLPPTMAEVRRPTRRGSTLLAGVRRITSIGQHA